MKPEPRQSKMIRIILDSNALFVPLMFKVDIMEELKTLINRDFEPVLLPPIRQELERLARKGSPKMRKNASYALKLADQCRLVGIDEESASTPDDAIVRAATVWNCPVFTNDCQLRKRLRNINVPVIYVRQKSRLEIDGRM